LPEFGKVKLLAVIEVVVKLLAFIDPLTSRLNPGEVVLIPTFPPVVKILPTVLLLPTAARRVLARTTPAETLVSTRFVDVILTAVKVPATYRFCDKVILAAVISEVEIPELKYPVPPTRAFPPMPTPPLTVKAPDVVFVDSLVPLTEICSKANVSPLNDNCFSPR